MPSPQNEVLLEIFQELRQHIEKQRKIKLSFSLEDIFNPHKLFYQPYNLPPKLEFLRRVTNEHDQESLLIQEEDKERYNDTIAQIKQRTYFADLHAWQSLISDPRVKNFIAHSYLLEQISEDELMDSFAAIEIMQDCEKFQHKFKIVELTAQESCTQDLLKKFDFLPSQEQDFLNALNTFKTAGIPIACWLIDKSSQNTIFSKKYSPKSEDTTLQFCLKIIGYRFKLSTDHYILLSSAVFKALLKIQRKADAVLPRTVLGVSSFRSVTCSLLEGHRDYALNIATIKSLNEAHGFNTISINAFHEKFHAWKCSSIPKNMREIFIHAAGLIKKTVEVLKNTTKISCDIYTWNKEDWKRLEEVANYLTDQEFPDRFGHASDEGEKTRKDFMEVLLDLTTKGFVLILMDMVINRSFWEESFDFTLEKFITEYNFFFGEDEVKYGTYLYEKIELLNEIGIMESSELIRIFKEVPPSNANSFFNPAVNSIPQQKESFSELHI